ncbi:MAG: AAA family ATPase [Clostridia bacterium]|nr:AAA family ATPase [Clostridia bacterium]
MKPYIESFTLLTNRQELDYIWDEVNYTCYDTFYPFKIFMDDRLPRIDFEPITIFYGGNGSGKSTLLNMIAEKAEVIRTSPFNKSVLFPEYVKRTTMKAREIPRHSRIMTSDDVFEHILKVRNFNYDIDDRRDELLDEYYGIADPFKSPKRLNSLSDYDEWKKEHEIKSGKLSASRYVRQNMRGNIDMHSNGENAMLYFVDNITEDAVYLLDEPENSLSIEYQLRLKEFLEDSARHFGCQLIITTHSPILLSMKGAKIYDLDEFPVETKSWTELPNVRKYFEFFEEHREEF